MKLPRRISHDHWRTAPGSIAACGLALALVAACRVEPQPKYLDLATTTGVKNSGMVDAVLSSFPGVKLRVHATGSGRALEMLADGVVDVAITQAPDTEARYILAHPEWGYRKFAYNRFVLVGPPEDPARVHEAPDAVEAFRRIAASPMTFISRGDQSGTHQRELALWRAAGVMPPGDHLIISGDGMATALAHAHERQGYTLSDDTTFRQVQPRLDVVVLLSDNVRLLNTYAVVYPRGYHSAVAFAEWLAVGDGRRKLHDYTIGGIAAFTTWSDGCRAETPDAQPCS